MKRGFDFQFRENARFWNLIEGVNMLGEKEIMPLNLLYLLFFFPNLKLAYVFSSFSMLR